MGSDQLALQDKQSFAVIRPSINPIFSQMFSGLIFTRIGLGCFGGLFTIQLAASTLGRNVDIAYGRADSGRLVEYIGVR